jgi:hypothetical protein
VARVELEPEMAHVKLVPAEAGESQSARVPEEEAAQAKLQVQRAS